MRPALGGRLSVAQDPAAAGGSDTLARSELSVPNGSGYQVTHTTADGVATTYRVELLPSGDEQRTTLNPDGTQALTVIGADGSRSVTQADGTTQHTTLGPDPRFGMQAPLETTASLSTPDGLHATVSASRTTALSNPTDPLSLTTQTDSVAVNGRPPTTSTYTAATRVTTDTTPAGRQTQTTVDAKGRVTRVQAASLHPLRLSYDADGRPATMKYGPDPDTAATRVNTVTYVDDFAIAFEDYPAAAKGQVKTSTDAAGRTTGFEYDPAARVSAQVLPGGRRVEFRYNPAGNVVGITPPGRPEHAFAYTPINLEASYTPPVVPPLTDTDTTYTYTADRQLDLVTRPDDVQLDYHYDAAGRLDTLTLLPANEQHDYVYDPDTGKLAQIVTPQATLEMSDDGSLPTGEAWSGPGLTSASVTKTYDASLRLQSQQIAVGNTSQPAITFAYDNDDLLTQAGALTLTRDPSNGLVRATSITAGAGTVTDASDYTSFGELQHYVAKYNGTPFFEQTYSRDTLGRISSITETQTLAPAPPTTTVKFYKYDTAGRLWRVCPDDACTTITSEYLYDPNGNRLAGSFNQSGTLTAAVYDDQDRLISTQSSILGPQSYTYTANGEEQTKTDASGQTTYTYDALGNLRQVLLPDGTLIDYVVDGRNRRIGKKATVNNATVLERQWLYEDQLEPVAELDGQGNVVAEFIYASKPHVASYIKRSGQTYRIVSDYLGSVRLVVNVADGTVVQRVDYDELGRAALLTGTLDSQPFGFAGGVYDTDTALVRFGARDYDPQIGRWTTKDPTRVNAEDANLYGYVLQDPINATDSLGLSADATLEGQFAGCALGKILLVRAISFGTGIAIGLAVEAASKSKLEECRAVNQLGPKERGEFCGKLKTSGARGRCWAKYLLGGQGWDNWCEYEFGDGWSPVSPR